MSMEERQRLIELERRVLKLELIVADMRQSPGDVKSPAGDSGDQKPESAPIGTARETLKVPKRG